MPKRKKRITHFAETAIAQKTKRRCLLRVSIQDGVIESHLKELWERQGCITVDDRAAI